LASGLFTWTPSPAQAPSTNTITARASDNGTPSMSATVAFHVFVRLPPAASITPPVNGMVSLSFPTIPGKTYRVEFKNHLNDISWTALPQGNNQVAGGTSLIINDDIGQSPQRFYRIEVVN
jgi:hypothetical protein